MPERLGPIKLTRPIIAGFAICGLLLIVILVASIAGGGASKAEKGAGSPAGASATTAASNVTNGCVSTLPEDQAPSAILGPEATLYGDGTSTNAPAAAAVAISCTFFTAVKGGDAAGLYAVLGDEWRSNLTQAEFAAQLQSVGSPRYRNGADSVLLAPGMTVASRTGTAYAWGRTKSTYTNGPFKVTEYAEIVWENVGKGWQLLSWDPGYDVRIERTDQYRPATLNNIEDRELYFTDTNRQTAAVAQLNPGLLDGGRFAMEVPGVGWFRSPTPGTVTATSDGTYRLNFKGAGTLTRPQNVLGLAGASFDTWDVTEPADFEFDIDYSPKADQAWAILKTAAGQVYIVETRQPVPSPRAVADQVITLTKGLDFASVAKLQAKGSSASQQAFLAASAEVQKRWPKAVDIRRSTSAYYSYIEHHGDKEYWRKLDDDEMHATYGITYALAGAPVQGKPATTTLYSAELTLSWEDGQWKVVGFPTPKLAGGMLKSELRCQGKTADGTLFLRWGVTNAASFPTTIAAGADNGFDPVPLDRGQLKTFLPGRSSETFDTAVDKGATLTWSLNDQKTVGTGGTGPACP